MTGRGNLGEHLQAIVLKHKQSIFMTSNQNLHCPVKQYTQQVKKVAP